MVAFAQTNHSHTDELRRLREFGAWDKHRSVHSKRIDEAFFNWQSVLHHCIPNEIRWTQHNIGSFQFPVHSGEHPTRDWDIRPRTPDITLAFHVTVVTGRVAVWAIHSLQ